jgi:hypothetical protein
MLLLPHNRTAHKYLIGGEYMSRNTQVRQSFRLTGQPREQRYVNITRYNGPIPYFVERHGHRPLFAMPVQRGHVNLKIPSCTLLEYRARRACIYWFQYCTCMC